MRFSIILVLVGALSAVAARPETNARRLARGLPPLPPARRATPVDLARRTHPSGTYSSCDTGPVQCCNSVSPATAPVASLISGLLGITIPANVLVGLTCSPISLAGSVQSCSQQTVCCKNNNFNGLIAIDCSPINIL